MKQAYLIIAHNKFEQLEFLITLLDYKKHDIYIYVDSKVSITSHTRKSIMDKAESSKIIFVDSKPVYWGSYSQIEAEMILFKTAQENDDYNMYHLLSGVDLPLVSAEQLYHFFELNKGYNFLTMVSDKLFYRNKVEDRVKYHYLFTNINHRMLSNKILLKLLKIYRKIEKGIQSLFSVNKIKKYDIKLKYASNWLSLSKEAVQIIISEEEWINKVFKNSIICDELFVPTVLEKHNLMYTLYSEVPTNDLPTDFQGNLRYINWWDGFPYTWTNSEKDMQQLRIAKQKGHMFSRKFDLEKYPNMKDEILKLIKE